MHSMSIEISKKNTSEALIDGLFGGILGGLGMLIFLTVVGLLGSKSLVETLNRFGLTDQISTPLSGVLLHLGVSAVYGAIFAVILHFVQPKLPQGIPGWAWGAGYGLVLWLFAASLLLPTTGSDLLELPAWQFASAHLIFGAILGWFCTRS